MITYDYHALDDCIRLMSERASAILEQTEALRSDVKKILVDWKGSTAESYDAIANDLASDLRQNHDNLLNLRSGLSGAAERMQEQDRNSARQVASS